MELSAYDLVKAFDSFDYSFYSEGPKGRIRKIVRIRPVKRLGPNAFNLAFGDLDETSGQLNDKVVSNNHDRLKILNTVAIAVLDFMGYNPNAFVLVKGSSLSRTRLYQMTINSFWPLINRQFILYGKIGDDWLPFKKGANDEEFMLFKKIA
jgi:hypothetical protein